MKGKKSNEVTPSKRREIPEVISEGDKSVEVEYLDNFEYDNTPLFPNPRAKEKSKNALSHESSSTVKVDSTNPRSQEPN